MDGQLVPQSQQQRPWSLSSRPGSARRRRGRATAPGWSRDRARLRAASRRASPAADGCGRPSRRRTAAAPRRRDARCLPGRARRAAPPPPAAAREMWARTVPDFCRLQRRIEPAHRAFDEAADLIRTAEQIAPALPFRGDFLGLDRVLREARARAALALLGVAPARLHRRGYRRQGRRSRLSCRVRPLRSSTAFISAPVTAPRSSGSGTVTPVAFRICLGLAQDDLEHRAVDRAVGRIEQHGADELAPAGRSDRPGPRAADGGSDSRTDRSG